jgi:hypothetical protein
MSEEGDILELEELDQLSEAVYVSLEGVEGRLLGFFGEAAAEVIDGDNAEVVAECGHKFSPCEAPGRVPVDHEKWRSGTFVEVVLNTVAGTEPMRFEGKFGLEAASILGACEELLGDVGGVEEQG